MGMMAPKWNPEEPCQVPRLSEPILGYAEGTSPARFRGKVKRTECEQCLIDDAAQIGHAEWLETLTSLGF